MSFGSDFLPQGVPHRKDETPQERADVLVFIPKAECDAKDNLKGFIDGCRDHSTIFGRGLDWEADEWDVTQYSPRRGRRGRIALVFSNWETAGVKSGAVPMAQPFRDFAKAYIRYRYGLRETKNFNTRMAALRVVEHVLVEMSWDGIPRPERIDPHVLNRAIQLVQERMEASAYHVGNQLEMLGDFISGQRMTKVPFVWKCPVPKPDDHNIRIGRKAAERRISKLPTEEAISSLGEAFHTATAPVDILVSSIVGLLLSSPDRINEVFRLPVNCEHEGHLGWEHKYGLRWWPSKGAEPFIKPIIATMIPIAKAAIQKLVTHTAEARRMALWYETNPGKLYLPPGLEGLRRNEYLSSADIVELIGLNDGGDQWARRNGCEALKEGQQLSFRFEDVEQAVVKMLPRGFPVMDIETGLKYSEALVLVPKNFFHQRRATYRCMFEIVTIDCINNQLGSGEKHGKSSVFSRMGFTEEDGSSIKVTSHQFRHLLNTLAQKKGLDQWVIATWSGRKHVPQNADYDHESAEELLDRMEGNEPGNLPAGFVPNPPVTREEFLVLQHETVHTTLYGFCVHRWETLPCQKVRACLDCTEHVCIKGDRKKTERVRQCLRETTEQLARDEEAVANGFYGADKWLTLNRARVVRLKNLVDIFDDPSIPVGTVIEMTNRNEYSPIRLAVEQRRLLGDADARMLNRVQKLVHTGAGARLLLPRRGA